MNKKHIFLLFLTLLPLSSLNSMQTQQNEPANLALALLYKLYAPHKIELNNIRKKLDIYLNKFRTFSAEIDTLVSIPESTKQRFILKIEKKTRKIEEFLAKITSIQTALAHCPSSLKTERAQNALILVANRFLGENNPEIITKKALNLLEITQELLKKVQSK
jgi:glycerophosphoryl diester phosphodiesterase